MLSRSRMRLCARHVHTRARRGRTVASGTGFAFVVREDLTATTVATRASTHKLCSTAAATPSKSRTRAQLKRTTPAAAEWHPVTRAREGDSGAWVRRGGPRCRAVSARALTRRPPNHGRRALLRLATVLVPVPIRILSAVPCRPRTARRNRGSAVLEQDRVRRRGHEILALQEPGYSGTPVRRRYTQSNDASGMMHDTRNTLQNTPSIHETGQTPCGGAAPAPVHHKPERRELARAEGNDAGPQREARKRVAYEVGLCQNGGDRARPRRDRSDTMALARACERKPENE